MPLTIELPDDILSLLEAEARAEGRTPGELAAERLRQSFATAPRNGNGAAPSAPRRNAAIPASARPIEQVIKEQREKHGFPPEWGTGTVQMTDEARTRIDQAFREMYPDFVSEDDHTK